VPARPRTTDIDGASAALDAGEAAITNAVIAAQTGTVRIWTMIGTLLIP
jgi:hypothetical protein